jgi:hypothetical protein
VTLNPPPTNDPAGAPQVVPLGPAMIEGKGVVPDDVPVTVAYDPLDNLYTSLLVAVPETLGPVVVTMRFVRKFPHHVPLV